MQVLADVRIPHIRCVILRIEERLLIISEIDVVCSAFIKLCNAERADVHDLARAIEHVIGHIFNDRNTSAVISRIAADKLLNARADNRAFLVLICG